MAAEGKSFYIGIGRGARANDRVRFVKYLMKRQRKGRTVKWVLSNEVISRLLRAGIRVREKILRKGLTRPRALAHEREIISWFQGRGVVLANRQHNGGAALTPNGVVRDVRRRLSVSRSKSG